MTPEEFMSAAKGTKAITGTDAITGNFAGFFAPEDTVIDALSVGGSAVTPATYLGSATIKAGCLVTISGYTNEVYATSIKLTSGSLVAIKA